MLIFAPGDIGVKFQSYMKGFQALDPPAHLGSQAMVINHPEFGRTMAVSFVWSSDDKEAGKAVLKRMESLGPVVMTTVAEIAPSAWQSVVESVVAMEAYADLRTVSLPTLSESTTKMISKHLEQMPSDIGGGFVTHENSGVSAKATPSSCFGARPKHYMLELIGSVVDKENEQEFQAWAKGLHEELAGGGEACKFEYISLTKPGDVQESDCYGEEDWEFIKELKRKYDPRGVFNTAIPRLGEHL